MRLTDQFCEDMLAEAGKSGPVIGRDRETVTVMEILCRKHKNNPALIGEPGVGKTAIVEGLAQRMASGRVPERLRNKRLMCLNLAGLLAGTKYRGEFEERVRDLVAEVRRSGNIILFVDEMHTLVGAGSAEGAIDAANLLKPALGRGEIQIIGATTPEEYRKFVERDGALERRFRPVTVPEPSPEETEEILQGLRPGLERHHGVAISPEAVHSAVELSCRYITNRFLPDKAVDLLDEGAAHVAMGEQRAEACLYLQQRQEISDAMGRAVGDSRFEDAMALRDQMQQLLHRQAEPFARRYPVSPEDLAQVVSERTGIPVGKITESERKTMQTMEQELRRRVIGQEEACRIVAAAVRRSRTGLRDEKRPVASLLFMGPTGVGKTELCRVLAKQVYGTEEALLQFDMSEYMEKHTVSRLIGAPPGYVGHGEPGELTEKVRRRPYSVVLLDEMEKAHRSLQDILLQIMDRGALTDSMGRKTDFRNVILIMTSNLGMGTAGTVGFGAVRQGGRDSKCLKEYFSPEFLGRLDSVAVFSPLSEEDLTEIAEMQLTELCQRAARRGLYLEIAPGVGRYLAKCCGGEGGARELRRYIREKIEDVLAEDLLTFPEEKTRRICLENGIITVEAKRKIS